MWSYEKKLQFPVKITRPDARMAKIMIEQYGGANCFRVYKKPPSGGFSFTILPQRAPNPKCVIKLNFL